MLPVAQSRRRAALAVERPSSVPALLAVTSIGTFTEVESTLQFLLEQVPEDEPGEPTMVVGFDAEWAVKLVYGGHGGVVSSTRGDGVAVVQLAWKRNTYVIQVRASWLCGLEFADSVGPCSSQRFIARASSSRHRSFD